MSDFYETMLNIKRYDKEKVLKEINSIVIEELEDVLEYVSDLEELFVLLCSNIKNRLDNINLNNKKINLNTLKIDTNYSFLICRFKDLENTINYVLIDPAYRTFLSKEEPKTPLNILQKSNSKLLNELLNCGFSIIDKDTFKNYINSFGIDYELEDIMLSRFKEVPNEATIKNNKKWKSNICFNVRFMFFFSSYN